VGSSNRRNRSIGFAEADDCPDDAAAPTVGPELGRSSKPLRVSCGTESSNPFPSSGESANHGFLNCLGVIAVYDRSPATPSHRLHLLPLFLGGSRPARSAGTFRPKGVEKKSGGVLYGE
jgi:hypothetical protein